MLDDVNQSPSSFPGLGLGCVTFGREIDRPSSYAMMDHALKHGLTFFDTAAAYGSGASEEIVGQWIAERDARAKIVLATKILPPYSPGAIEASVSASLQRLGLPSVDVLFLHRWDESAVQPDVLRALHGLVADGRVGLLGASNYSTAQLERTLDLQSELMLTPFRSLQTIHNFAVRSVDASTRALCSRAQVAIVGFSPLGAGFLTGKHEAGVQPGSRFDIIPGHQNVYFNDLARHRLARLKDVAARSGLPLTQLALAWAIQQAPVATVLVGGRTPAHLDQALEARAFSAPDVLRELDAE
jgi:aryl-alcohol dehydrogenase-like predicted oxidoreductase